MRINTTPSVGLPIMAGVNNTPASVMLYCFIVVT
jgi:hypothetical protein